MIRVRFSPAPTGSLHIGSARTALFNWLYARHARRHVRPAHRGHRRRALAARSGSSAIQDTLRWLGLDWDEGPFLQSDALRPVPRRRRPAARAGRRVRVLLHRGRGQASATTPRSRPGARPATTAAAATSPPTSAPRCAAEGRPRVDPVPHARRRAEHASPTSIRGEVQVEWSTISDFVIVRSDGTPMFFLANAVDDLDMGITHVIRGEDLIDSTHRVLALRARARRRPTRPCTRTCR